MVFVKAEGRDRREVVLDQLLEFVAEKKDAAGSKLPPEGDLARMFGVSRTVIREAMRSLQATGVVRIEQGRGTFISEHPFSQPFNVWATLNAHRVNELFEVRIILEGESASRAAAQRAKPDLLAIEDTIEVGLVQTQECDWDGAMASDREFHRLVTKMAKLPMLQEMLEVAVPTWMHVTAKFGAEDNRESRMRFVLKEHRAVFNAIQQGEPNLAREAMQRHLRNSLQRRLKNDRVANAEPAPNQAPAAAEEQKTN